MIWAEALCRRRQRISVQVQTEPGPSTIDKDAQANRGMSASEKDFMECYIRKARELEEIVAEQARMIERCEDELRILRREAREHALLREHHHRVLLELREARAPDPIVVTVSGSSYHREDCGNISRSRRLCAYGPCQNCLR